MVKITKELSFRGKYAVDKFLSAIEKAKQTERDYYERFHAGLYITCDGKKYELHDYELEKAISLYKKSGTTEALVTLGYSTEKGFFSFKLRFNGENTILSAECAMENVLDAFFLAT